MNAIHRRFDERIAVLLVLLIPLLSGCDLIEGIFKVGFWAGVIIIVLIVVVIGAVVRMVGGSRT